MIKVLQIINIIPREQIYLSRFSKKITSPNKNNFLLLQFNKNKKSCIYEIYLFNFRFYKYALFVLYKI
uniref:Uncharacterized protein n=1 Tax=virus sp. ct8MV80 TaxID=2826793 RepID=A0A8S5R7E6_9VIRU|nr:MAG TPA: hypothetical protein [virus sp. ct8MV80]